MTTITNAIRKLIKKLINERIDQLQGVKARLQDQLTNLDKVAYNNNNQETVNNMDADQFEANLNTQITNIQDRIQKYKDFKDWLDEQVLS